ncbi:conserved hypothetical protein [Acidobacteriia bacterium SbA2]|nr:conserved hypothetical protein [Acidobacteriia bacterium SbA2]
MKITPAVAIAKLGVHFRSGTRWIPAYAGMTQPSSRGGSRAAPTSPIRRNNVIFGGARSAKPMG